MPCRLLLVISVTFVFFGCSTLSDEVVRINFCNINKNCNVQGKLVATQHMGSIRDESGCIAVALPEYVTDDWNLQIVRASGVIYKAPDYPGLVTYKLEGRTFDAEACYSGLAMIVDRIERTQTLPKYKNCESESIFETTSEH